MSADPGKPEDVAPSDVAHRSVRGLTVPSPGPQLALIQSPSLLQPVANGLAGAIAALSPASDVPTTARSVPLQVVSPPPLGLFRSPIALQVARRWQQPAMDISRRLLIHLHAQSHMPRLDSQGPISGGQLWVQAPGWIYLQCAERTLADWLQRLIHAPPRLVGLPLRGPIPPPAPVDPESLFRIQRAHARCWALLRLAQQERILPWPASGLEAPISDIPWLDRHQRLLLQHPHEQALIHQLLQLPPVLMPQSQVWTWGQPALSDEIMLVPWPLPSSMLWQQLQHWSEQILAFDRDCQIFGAVSRHTPALAQARLGLVSLTQAVLGFILSTLLQIHAPLEL